MGILFLYSFLLALLLSLMFIPFLIRHSDTLGLVDDPVGNDRKLHSTVIPRSGGLGIILSAALALLIVLPFDSSLLSFVLASLVVIFFGLIDDIVELKPLQKLCGQSIGIAIAMSGGMIIYNFPMWASCPLWINYAVTFIFVLGAVNGVNFSDGMDGLAAGTSLIALAVLTILAIESHNTQAAAVALAVAAALLGFLRFNTHPAGIYMGDSGSQFLGFVLAWLAISVSQVDSSPVSTLIPLLILGIPVMDIVQVVPVRIKKKLPLAGPDREHFHHQIAKLGFYHHEVVAIIYVLQAILLCAAFILRFANDQIVLTFYVVYLATILGALYAANTMGWRVRPIKEFEVSDRRNQLFRRFGAYHRYTSNIFVISIALFLVLSALCSDELSRYLVLAGFVWGMLLLATRYFFLSFWPLPIGRIASYTSTVLLIYGLTLSIANPAVNYLIDGFLVLLAIFLIFSIRITRRKYFWLNTADLLVVLFLLMLFPLLPLQYGQYVEIFRMVFRILVLIYTCEYILARGEKAIRLLTDTSVLALILLGLQL